MKHFHTCMTQGGYCAACDSGGGGQPAVIASAPARPARRYDPGLARMAGNIAAGLVTHISVAPHRDTSRQLIAEQSLDIARRIVALLEKDL